jgi:hypothetical protein
MRRIFIVAPAAYIFATDACISHCVCCVQASLLLLQTLDLETLLQLVAENGALTSDAHRFGSVADRERIDAELRSWWDGPSEAQTPVLLAWAAFTALANLISNGAQLPSS